MKHPLKDLANLLHRPVESAARSCPPHMLTALLEAVVEALHLRQVIRTLPLQGFSATI